MAYSRLGVGQKWEWYQEQQEGDKKGCRKLFWGGGYINVLDYSDEFTGIYTCQTYQTVDFKYVHYVAVYINITAC